MDTRSASPPTPVPTTRWPPSRAGTRRTLVAPQVDDPEVVVGLDAYWCDASGLYVRGFAHAGPRAIERVTLRNGDRASGQRPTARGDVAAFFPDGTVPPNCGFALYVEGRPSADLQLELDTEDGTLSTRVELPDHPLPLLEESHSADRVFERFLAEAPPGPVLTLGWRVAVGTDLGELKARFGSRPVFNVDIHPGLNVDVVGDVHRLSHFFRPQVFSAAFSASLLEHVVAPWLVAAELNRVLAKARQCCRSRRRHGPSMQRPMTSGGSPQTASRSCSDRPRGSRCSSKGL